VGLHLLIFNQEFNQDSTNEDC